MSLFQLGSFTLHSGDRTWFKIDCDALTDSDWETLAEIIHRRFRFGAVVGIPDGGSKLARALELFIEPGNTIMLIVDDVLTTGNSFYELALQARAGGFDGPIQGIVIFARGVCPSWVTPIFQMTQS